MIKVPASMDGLSIFIAHGGDATRVSSVASFFVSRIDTLIDDMVTRRMEQANDARSGRSLMATGSGPDAIARIPAAMERRIP